MSAIIPILLLQHLSKSPKISSRMQGCRNRDQILAKGDLLETDNNSEKKKEQKNINHIKFREQYW